MPMLVSFTDFLPCPLTENSDVPENQFFPSQANYPAIVGSTGLFPRNPMKYDDIDFANVRTHMVVSSLSSAFIDPSITRTFTEHLDGFPREFHPHI